MSGGHKVQYGHHAASAAAEAAVVAREMSVEEDDFADRGSGKGLYAGGRRCGPFTPDEEAAEVIQLMRGLTGPGGTEAVLAAHILGRGHTAAVADLAEAVEKINAHVEDGSPASASSIMGRIIHEGHVAFIEKKGVTSVVGPGRYLIYSPQADWIDKPAYRLQGNPHIAEGPIHIIRVPAGQYAKVFINNEPMLLSSEGGGLFAFNDPTLKFVDFVSVGDEHIRHATLNVLRINKGMYGLVEDKQKPYLLPTGEYAFKSDTFRFVGTRRLTDKSITHSTISRFYVPRGCIAKVWQDSVPMFIEERGVYLVDSPMFVFESIVDYDEPYISHGSKKIVTVKEGLVGVSHDQGDLTVLQPGRHIISREGHIFDEFLSTQQQCLALAKTDDAGAPPGTPSTVMVCETRELVRIGIQASVFYHIKNPKLAVVKIGERAMIEKFINETATAVITTIIRSTSLAEISQSGKGGPGAPKRGAPRQMIPKVAEVAAAAAAEDEDGDMRGDSEMPDDDDDGKGGKKGGKGDAEDEDYSPNLPFFDRMHKDFIDRLQKNFLQEYGVFMLNMRISDFNVIDTDIAQSISNHAKTMAQTQAKLANLEGNRKIDLVNKDSDARIERIQAEVEAHKVTVRAKADNEAFLEKTRATAEAAVLEANSRLRNKSAEAEMMQIEATTKAKTLETATKAEAEARKANALAAAEAMKTEAEAKAAAIKMIAEAEAMAIRMKAEAEAERAKRLGEIPFGREITLAEVQANMVRDSLAGVEKIVYLPTDLQKNPFALFSGGGASNLLAGAAMGGKS